jgi:hypothetical protein
MSLWPNADMYHVTSGASRKEHSGRVHILEAGENPFPDDFRIYRIEGNP